MTNKSNIKQIKKLIKFMNLTKCESTTNTISTKYNIKTISFSVFINNNCIL